MFYRNSVTIYVVKGLNFKKFLNKLQTDNIDIFKLEKKDYNSFIIGIKQKDKSKFLEISKKFNYEVCEEKVPFNLKVIRLIKNNIAISLSCLILIFSILTLNNFVLRVEIFGLENITKNEILQVLNANGYKKGKLKSSYDLDSIEKVLVSNLDKVSFASAIIKGNTLVVNVNEKIDNSDYICDYQPILAPFNLILKEINLFSGTLQYKIGDVVKQGEVIVVPAIVYENEITLSVPAKATIKAYVEVSYNFELSINVSVDEKKKVIEENQNKLYNMLCDYEIVSNPVFDLIEKAEDDIILSTLYLKAVIVF